MSSYHNTIISSRHTPLHLTLCKEVESPSKRLRRGFAPHQSQIGSSIIADEAAMLRIHADARTAGPGPNRHAPEAPLTLARHTKPPLHSILHSSCLHRRSVPLRCRYPGLNSCTFAVPACERKASDTPTRHVTPTCGSTNRLDR